MEVRVRASASRTSKGYSVDSTFELGGPLGVGVGLTEAKGLGEGAQDFVLAQLKRLMGLLEAEFPQEKT